MFSQVLLRLLPLINEIGEDIERQLPHIKAKLRKIINEHRRQMASDPNYPTMLIFLASILIKKYIRKQSQAATLIFLLEQTVRQAIRRLDWEGDWGDGDE